MNMWHIIIALLVFFFLVILTYVLTREKDDGWGGYSGGSAFSGIIDRLRGC